MKRIYFLIVTFFLTFNIYGQQQVYVRGYVVDEDNKGLQSINISLVGSTRSTVTNDNGYYELPIVLSENDTLVYFGLGYKDTFRALPDDISKAVNVNVVMYKDTTVLQSVDVSAIKRRKEMLVVDTKLLKLTPDAVGGIESIVKMQMGVSSTNELSSQYSVRGGNFDENAVYVNGIEIYRPILTRSSQQEGLSFVNPDLVEKVEFSAGGFAAKYADKMSSVLDIEYKQPKEFEGSLSLGFMGASAYVGVRKNKLSMIHGVRYKSNQYLLTDKIKIKGKPLFKGLDTKGDFNNYFVDYQTLINYDFSEKFAVSLLGNIAKNSYNFEPKSQNVSFGTLLMQRNFNVTFQGLEKDRFTTAFGALTFKYKPKEWVTLKFIASAFNTFEEENYDLVGLYSISDVKTDEHGDKFFDLIGSGLFHEHARNKLSATVINLSHTGQSKLWKTNVEWGISMNKEIIDDKIREYERRDSAQYMLPHSGNNLEMIYNLTSNNHMNNTRFQAYLQQRYSLRLFKARWIVNLGARANYWTFNNEWLLSPRINVICKPEWKTDIDFRMAIGVYYQSPFYKEVRQVFRDSLNNSYIKLNKKIKAQRSGHLLLGMDYYFRLWRRPFKFTMEAYYKPADRIIPYSVDNVRIRYAGENQAVAYTTGVDLKLFGEFVPGVDSWIAFSYMRSREDIVNQRGNSYGDEYKIFTNKGRYLGTVYPGYIPRPNEQRFSFSIFFQDYVPNHPEYKLNLKLVWADGLPFGPPHTERYKAIYRSKAYRRVDIGASRGFENGKDKLLSRQKFINSIWLHLDILNLFNIKNESSYYWVSDIDGYQWAVPNHLTNFMINFRVNINF